MQHPHPTVRWGFVAAGLVNVVGITALTWGFTNETLFNQDPAMSPVAAAVIVLRGLAYLAIATGYERVPWLVLVFAAECWFFVFVWVRWLAIYGARLGPLWEVDPFSGLYYTTYGVVDLVLGAFFLWVFATLVQE